MTGPEPVRTIDLNLPDLHHDHVLGKCPTWLPAESSSIKLDARTPSASKKDFKPDATDQRRENTVSALERWNTRRISDEPENESADLAQIVSQQLTDAFPALVAQIMEALRNDTENGERNNGTNGELNNGSENHKGYS
ncbi:hypothetical protein L1987_18645 [Smallanthus sonchifolius]|uniref:Uncharacterized protein n=1 Tax=Smallanthus sonchifolius TaxID=185202 RepID=A0ACB9J2A9_9ASTR|nr:hypothetical protein L1987_18645 [Smallanthus sonchifolius]